MNIHCKTNLDVWNEMWPGNLPAVPRVGDNIESATLHRGMFILTLKVTAVTWKNGRHGYYPEIELHDGQNRSIKEFFEWYAPLVGKSVSSFI